MAEEMPDLDVYIVPRTGHAPTLEEPEVTEVIGRWLTKVA
jgi:hypothetical protein